MTGLALSFSPLRRANDPFVGDLAELRVKRCFWEKWVRVHGEKSRRQKKANKPHDIMCPRRRRVIPARA